MSSSWNRPNNTPKSQPKKPSAMRGLLAGVAVVTIAVGCYYAFFASSTSKQPSTPAKATKIKEAAKPTPHKPRSFRNKNDNSKPKNVEEALANFGEFEKPVISRKTTVPLERLINPYTNRVFAAGTEQLMGWAFATPPGEMPFPMPKLDEAAKKDLVSMLISKIDIKDSDDDATAIAKDNVNEAKKEMLRYLKEGGDPDDFLQYYNNQLIKAYEYRSEAIKQIGELEMEDHDMGKEFLEKINEKLRGEGIKEIEPRLFGF